MEHTRRSLSELTLPKDERTNASKAMSPSHIRLSQLLFVPVSQSKQVSSARVTPLPLLPPFLSLPPPLTALAAQALDDTATPPCAHHALQTPSTFHHVDFNHRAAGCRGPAGLHQHRAAFPGVHRAVHGHRSRSDRDRVCTNAHPACLSCLCRSLHTSGFVLAIKVPHTRVPVTRPPFPASTALTSAAAAVCHRRLRLLRLHGRR